MVMENVEPVHECCPKHSRMGTAWEIRQSHWTRQEERSMQGEKIKNAWNSPDSLIIARAYRPHEFSTNEQIKI